MEQCLYTTHPHHQLLPKNIEEQGLTCSILPLRPAIVPIHQPQFLYKGSVDSYSTPIVMTTADLCAAQLLVCLFPLLLLLPMCSLSSRLINESSSLTLQSDSSCPIDIS
jgi:hypothetical protein